MSNNKRSFLTIIIEQIAEYEERSDWARLGSICPDVLHHHEDGTVSGESKSDTAAIRYLRHRALRAYRKLARAKHDERRAAAVEHANKVREIIKWDGVLYVEVWRRDCDMCEATSLYTFESADEFFAWRREAYKWAEGPMRISFLDPNEVEDFEPHFRDRALEAFENGRGTSIYV